MESPSAPGAPTSGMPIGGRVFNYNPRLNGRELSGWQLFRDAILDTARRPLTRAYFFRSASDGLEELRVTISERSSWREAQQYLGDWMSSCMRQDLKASQGLLRDRSDVAMAAMAIDADFPAAAWFTSGNVFVAVNSIGSRNVDVSRPTVQLAKWLLAMPAQSSARKRKSGMESIEVSAIDGERMVLIASLGQVCDDASSLRVTSPSGELARDGDSLLYTPSTSGKLRLRTSLIV